MDASPYIIFNFLIALIGYLLLPIVWCSSGKQYTIKQIKKRVITNSIIVYFIFVFLGGGNATAALCWSSVAYWMMKKSCLIEENLEESIGFIDKSQENTADLSSVKSVHENNNICKKCGKELYENSSYCHFCGKKVRTKKSPNSKKYIITVLVLVVVAVSTFSAFFIINYQHAVTSMNNQEFVIAKRHFDKIPYSEKLFSQKIEYINAGILIEQGKYTQALKALKQQSFTVPVSVIEDLTEKIYKQAVNYYHDANFDEARVSFRMIVDYKRSEDYLTLMRNKTPYYGNCDELINMLDFENTKSIIIENEICFSQFISGEWKTQNKSHYFKIDSNDKCTYNLPYFNISGGFYKIKDGIYSEGKEGSENRMQFKFSIIDKDTISVYCYKNNEKYTLYRQ